MAVRKDPSRFERDASAIGLHAVGAHGRICTDTVRVLGAPSLRWTTWAKLVPREGFGFPSPPQDGCPKWDVRYRETWSTPNLRPERSASGSWANAAKWYSRQESHLQLGGSKPPALCIELWGRKNRSTTCPQSIGSKTSSGTRFLNLFVRNWAGTTSTSAPVQRKEVFGTTRKSSLPGLVARSASKLARPASDESPMQVILKP